MRYRVLHTERGVHSGHVYSAIEADVQLFNECNVLVGLNQVPRVRSVPNGIFRVPRHRMLLRLHGPVSHYEIEHDRVFFSRWKSSVLHYCMLLRRNFSSSHVVRGVSCAVPCSTYCLFFLFAISGFVSQEHGYLGNLTTGTGSLNLYGTVGNDCFMAFGSGNSAMTTTQRSVLAGGYVHVGASFSRYSCGVSLLTLRVSTIAA